MLSCTHLRPRLLISPLAALCLLLAPHIARAQDSAKPPKDEEEVVRISSDLVQTDVMVFDRAGKFVDGLKPEQFELRVDGKSRQIVFFDRVEAGTVNEDAQLAAARGTKNGAGNGAALPLDRGRTVMFFVDDFHLAPDSLVRARRVLTNFVENELGQNDQIMIASASGQIGFLQQLTSDKAVLRAAIARLGNRQRRMIDMEQPPMTENQAFIIDADTDPSVLDWFLSALRRSPVASTLPDPEAIRARARQLVAQSTAITTNTLAALEGLVRSSAQLPGRKVVFFISDGFYVSFHSSATAERLRRIADAGARSGVVIYTMDARGLATQPSMDASRQPVSDFSGALTRSNATEIESSQEPLHTLAADTGGRALLNTNALEDAIPRALRETSRYYLLAWRPEAEGTQRGTPKYQNIEVSVRGRADLRVIVRRGFYNAPPVEDSVAEKKKKRNEGESAEKQKPPAERDLLAALRAPLPRGALPISLALNFISAPDGGAALTASVELDLSALIFEQSDKRRATFDVIGLVLDDNGKSVRSFGQQLNVTGDASDAAAPDARQRAVFSFQFRVPPGLYQVRVAARDTRGGRTGSAMQWVEIPEFKPGQLSLSSVFIGERREAVVSDSARPEELSQGVLLSVDRRFARTSWIRFMAYIYNAAPGPSAQPDVALQIQIFRDDQPVFTAPLKKVETEGMPDASRIPYAAEMALASFPAGRYVLQLTAIDRAAKTTATQRTSFIIE